MMVGEKYPLQGGGEVEFVGPGSIPQKIRVRDPITGEEREIYRQRLAKPGAPKPPPKPVDPPTAITPKPQEPTSALPEPSPVLGEHSALIGELTTPMPKVFRAADEYDIQVGDTTDFRSWKTGTDNPAPGKTYKTIAGKQYPIYSVASYHTGQSSNEASQVPHPSKAPWTDNPEGAFVVAASQVVDPPKMYHDPKLGEHYRSVGNLMSMDRALPGSVDTNFTWRHEFGHSMDAKMGGGRELSQAGNTFGKQISALRYTWAGTNKKTAHAMDGLGKYLSDEGSLVTGFSGPKTERLLADMERAFPEFKQGELVGYLRNSFKSVNRIEQGKDVSKLGRDIFQKEWTPKNTDNYQRYLNVAVLQTMVSMRNGDPLGAYRAGTRNDRQFTWALSDIIDGATTGAQRQAGGSGHGKDYWNKRHYGMHNEAFANLTTIAGGSRSGNSWKIAKRLLPGIADEYEKDVTSFIVDRKRATKKGATP